MGLFTGSLTFRRFRVGGPKPGMWHDGHLARLREFQFDQRESLLAGQARAGWTAGSHIYDTEFSEMKNIFPDHLVWEICVEADKLPQDRLKAYYETDLKALTADNKTPYPSARQKREARESAKSRLSGEAADGRYRRWKTYPVAWDAVRNEVCLGTTSSAVADRFVEKFVLTFEANLYQTPGFADKLRPINAANLAVDLKPEAKDERLSRFVDGLPDTPNWNPSESDPHFLGNEFMLWLWHRAESGEDTLALSDDSEVAYMFSGGIKLDCPRGNLGNDTLNHESAIRLPEARAAARSGKLPRKAALTIVRHDNQFSFKFDAESFAFGSARLPKPDAMGTREQHEQRLGWLRDLGETIDLMYQAFLARRLSSYWEAELRDIRAWLGQTETVSA